MTFDAQLSRLAERTPYLDADEERELLIRAKSGDTKAADRIVLAHLKLAMKVAMKFRHHGVSPDDLVHEGIIGLQEALPKFDLAQPVRFSTFARWSVEARVRSAAMRGASLVRFGETLKGKAMFFGLKAARAKLERTGDLSRTEIDRRLAVMFGVKVDVIETMTARLGGADTSLDEPIPGTQVARGMALRDDADLPDSVVERRQDIDRRNRMVALALGALNAREVDVIRARILVEDEDEQTLQTVAERFGVTRERVRQIEAAALGKMRRVLGQEVIASPN